MKRKKLEINWMAALPIFLLAMACANTAAAQSFNIDLGLEYGTPDAAFGAAANQSGHWNESGPGSGTIDNLAGDNTSVIMSIDVASDGHNVTDGSDASKLLDDQIHDCGAQNWSVQFEELGAGIYDVYVYASGNTAVSTGEMEVQGESLGALAGNTRDLTEGESWAVSESITVMGELLISGSGTEPNAAGCSGAAGIQLVFQAPLNTIYADRFEE